MPLDSVNPLNLHVSSAGPLSEFNILFRLAVSELEASRVSVQETEVSVRLCVRNNTSKYRHIFLNNTDSIEY